MRAVWVVVLAACGPAQPMPPAEPVSKAPPPPVVAADASIVADAAAAPPRAPLAVTGQLTVLADVPAWGTAVVDGKVAVIDPGFTSVTAIDAATGGVAWHAALETEAKAMHSLHVLPGAIGAWFGPVLHVLDPATGKERVAANAPWNGSPWNDGGCGIDIAGGVCAWRCQCSYQVFDCASGAGIGKHYEENYMEMFPMDGPPSAGCWGTGGATFGRAGKLALFRTEDAAGGGPMGAHSKAFAIAIDVATGAEAWRTPTDASFEPSRSGMSPDRATCWLGGYDAALGVFDCATGKSRWQLPGDPQPVPYFFVTFAPPHGLFELRGRRATLYDERSGTVRWRVELPPSTMGWPLGLTPTLYWEYQKIGRIALLDLKTGKTLATLPHPDGAAIVPVETGAIVAGDEIRRFGTNGKVVAKVDIAKAGLLLGEERALVVTDTEVIVFALPVLAELGRIPGKFVAWSVEGALGVHRALLWAYDGKTVGRAIVVKLGT